MQRTCEVKREEAIVSPERKEERRKNSLIEGKERASYSRE